MIKERKIKGNKSGKLGEKSNWRMDKAEWEYIGMWGRQWSQHQWPQFLNSRVVYDMTMKSKSIIYLDINLILSGETRFSIIAYFVNLLLSQCFLSLGLENSSPNYNQKKLIKLFIFMSASWSLSMTNNSYQSSFNSNDQQQNQLYSQGDEDLALRSWDFLKLFWNHILLYFIVSFVISQIHRVLDGH